MMALAGVSCAPPAPSSAASPAATIALRPPRPLGTSAWERIALPASPSDLHGIDVSPVDPATILACTAHLQTPPAPGFTPAQPMTLWRTADAGAHWMRYAPPLGAGTWCFFSVAPNDPRRVTIQVTQSGQDGQPCAHDTFYLSDDGGMTWRRLPPHAPDDPGQFYYVWCELHVTRHHLFLAYSYEPSFEAPQVSRLERSDDDGTTWTRADRGLGSGALFSMPDLGPGDTLAMTVLELPVHAGAEATWLWTSGDAGRTWQRTNPLPDGAGTFLLAPPPRSGGSWPAPDRPFYALEEEQIPSALYWERVLASPDGRGWTLLPPLPVPGVSEVRRGILQTLAVLPGGRLVAWGSDPRAGVPAPGALNEPIAQFWPWLWDPVAQRWQVLASPLDAPVTEGCGLCWGAWSTVGRDGAAYLYVARFDGGSAADTPPGMFRLRLLAGT
jgi:hypothetical protein